ncbi:unnamed protein product [Trichogramma brassicae]|uniref:Uncharacterized protein n=1 Tax=Trichogramma brassicae TaxID=86971 RepID=A0A6H5HSS1_9HYME|nr:unnamed protein product [Trichogramma brassicae]
MKKMCAQLFNEQSSCRAICVFDHFQSAGGQKRVECVTVCGMYTRPAYLHLRESKCKIFLGLIAVALSSVSCKENRFFRRENNHQKKFRFTKNKRGISDYPFNLPFTGSSFANLQLAPVQASQPYSHGVSALSGKFLYKNFSNEILPIVTDTEGFGAKRSVHLSLLIKILLLLSPAVICTQRLRKSTNPNDEPFLPIYPVYPYNPKLMKRGLEQTSQQQQQLHHHPHTSQSGQGQGHLHYSPELYAPKTDARDSYSASYGNSYYPSYDSLTKTTSGAQGSPLYPSALSSYASGSPYTNLFGSYSPASGYGTASSAFSNAALTNFANQANSASSSGAGSSSSGSSATPALGHNTASLGSTSGLGPLSAGALGLNPALGMGSPLGAGPMPFGGAGAYPYYFYQPPYSSYYPNFYNQPPYPPHPGYHGKLPYDDYEDDEASRRVKGKKHHKNKVRNNSDPDSNYVDGVNYLISSDKDLDGESSTHRTPSRYNQLDNQDTENQPRTVVLPKATYRLVSISGQQQPSASDSSPAPPGYIKIQQLEQLMRQALARLLSQNAAQQANLAHIQQEAVQRHQHNKDVGGAQQYINVPGNTIAKTGLSYVVNPTIISRVKSSSPQYNPSSLAQTSSNNNKQTYGQKTTTTVNIQPSSSIYIPPGSKNADQSSDYDYDSAETVTPRATVEPTQNYTLLDVSSHTSYEEHDVSGRNEYTNLPDNFLGCDLRVSIENILAKAEAQQARQLCDGLEAPLEGRPARQPRRQEQELGRHLCDELEEPLEGRPERQPRRQEQELGRHLCDELEEPLEGRPERRPRRREQELGRRLCDELEEPLCDELEAHLEGRPARRPRRQEQELGRHLCAELEEPLCDELEAQLEGRPARRPRRREQELGRHLCDELEAPLEERPARQPRRQEQELGRHLCAELEEPLCDELEAQLEGRPERRPRRQEQELGRHLCDELEEPLEGRPERRPRRREQELGRRLCAELEEPLCDELEAHLEGRPARRLRRQEQELGRRLCAELEEPLCDELEAQLEGRPARRPRRREQELGRHLCDELEAPLEERPARQPRRQEQELGRTSATSWRSRLTSDWSDDLGDGSRSSGAASATSLRGGLNGHRPDLSGICHIDLN